MSRLRWDPYPGTVLFVVVIVLVAGVPEFVHDRAGVNVWWSLAAVVFSLVQLVCLGWLFWWALLGGWRRERVHYVREWPDGTYAALTTRNGDRFCGWREEGQWVVSEQNVPRYRGDSVDIKTVVLRLEEDWVTDVVPLALQESEQRKEEA